MRIFNKDGSEAEMCGNGIRCVGKYVYDKGLTKKEDISIETLAGIKKLHLICEGNVCHKVEVDMGEPAFKGKDLPCIEGEITRNLKLQVKNEEFEMTAVSMGNPHAVIFVEDIEKIPLELYGPIIENNRKFPNRTNVEFVQVCDDSHIKMRVWERGSGETMACGTGACAAAVASGINGYTNSNVKVMLPGGELTIEWKEEDNHVYMTGDATTIFEGVMKEI